jgi:cytochrome c peroxidase
LRNEASTAPYLHHGKFKTLLDHYASGVKSLQTLDPLLRQPDGTLGISLTQVEKTSLIAFLKTLTDEPFLRDVRFAE